MLKPKTITPGYTGKYPRRHGVLRRGTTIVWTCSHDHQAQWKATQCARQALKIVAPTHPLAEGNDDPSARLGAPLGNLRRWADEP